MRVCEYFESTFIYKKLFITIKIFISPPFVISKKLGLKIEKLKNIIVNLKRLVVAEVGKVVERMKVVVVSEPRVVVEVQEKQV